MNSEIISIIILINISLVVLFYNKLSENGTYKFSFAFLNSLYIVYAFIFFPFIAYFLNIANPYNSISVDSQFFFQANLLITVYLVSLNFGIYISNLRYSNYNSILYKVFNFDFINNKSIFLYLFILYTLLRIYIFSSILGEYDPISIIQNRATFDKYFINYNLAYILDPLNGICSFIYLILIFNYFTRKKYYFVFFITCIHLYSSSLYGSRAQFILIFIFLFIVYYIVFKKIRFLYLLLFIVSSILIFAYLGSLRTGNDFIIDFDFLFRIFYYRSDYIPGITKLIKYISIDEINYYYGKSFIDFIFSFLPRSFIGYKPPSTEVLLTYILYGSSNWTLAFGGLGEMFYNFSYYGVFIWFIIVGFFIDRINKLFIYSLNIKNYILTSFLLSSPFYLHGWNMGINVSPTRKFIIIYSFILINLIVIKSIEIMTNRYNKNQVLKNS